MSPTASARGAGQRLSKRLPIGLGAAVWLGLAAQGCAPSVSHTPLYNSAPEGAEQYFYGPALPHEQAALVGSAPLPAPNPFTRSPPSATSRVARKVASPPPTAGASGDAGTESVVDRGTWAGDYRGIDHVTIHLPGVPKSTEDDPKARARVSETANGSFSVAVLDSSNGTELCTLVGAAKGSRVEFEPGQDCFDGVLGFDASTELKQGYAELSDDQLVIDFEVTIEALDADATGSLVYRFEGARD